MTPFTDLEYLEIGEYSIAGDVESLAAAYHSAECRREIETLIEQGRICDAPLG